MYHQEPYVVVEAGDHITKAIAQQLPMRQPKNPGMDPDGVGDLSATQMLCSHQRQTQEPRRLMVAVINLADHEIHHPSMGKLYPLRDQTDGADSTRISHSPPNEHQLLTGINHLSLEEMTLLQLLSTR
jgi:hypothetical protein